MPLGFGKGKHVYVNWKKNTTILNNHLDLGLTSLQR